MNAFLSGFMWAVKIVPSLLACLPGLCGSALAADAGTISTGPGVITEYWDGRVLTASFRAGMCFEADGKARGVLILRHSSGKEDVYHLYGAIKNNEFTLRHGSGHEFTGSLNDGGTMEGKVRLANGMRISLKGERHRHAVLAAEDCAPLPQSSRSRQ